MRIHHRILLVFVGLVTFLMAVLCLSIYFYSAKDRSDRFYNRLVTKAHSTAILIEGKEYELVKKMNEGAAAGLQALSLHLYDLGTGKTFRYNSPGVPSLQVTEDIIRRPTVDHPYRFSAGYRDAVAIRYERDRYQYVVVTAAHDAYTKKWLQNLLSILVSCFFLSLILALLVGHFFAAGIVKSIRQLTHKINHISSEAISERLEIGKKEDELDKLAETVNQLLDRLQTSFDTQRRFISNASHELSTPLAAITSQLDVALQRDRSPEEYRKVFLSVKDDMKRLALLLRSLLEIAKAGGSQGGLDLQSIRVDEMLMAMPSEIKKISPLYDVRLHFADFPEKESTFIIYGNYALLYSALRNFVHNACKFSKNSTAEVTLSYTFQYVVVEVVDQGPGISPEDQKNIFQPFFRGHRQDNKIYGSGLGLALAHRIIGLHKGHIELFSQIDVGTRFVIYLPRNEYGDATH